MFGAENIKELLPLVEGANQPLNRVTPQRLLNLCLLAMSPHANGTRNLSLLFVSGKIKGRGGGGILTIKWVNEESGNQEMLC